MPPVYVTGHRNPDMDSIAAAVGYAELKNVLDPGTAYVPVRLGELNPQTRWVLDRAGAAEPEFLPHVKLRVGDIMQTSFARMQEDDPIREAGLAIDHADYDLVPVVNDASVLSGVITTRVLARRYVRESRTSSVLSVPTSVHAVTDVLEGELLCGEDRQLTGRVLAHAMSENHDPGIGEGDVAVVGDRAKAQRQLIELGVGLMILSNGTRPDPEVLEMAKQRGIAIVVSPLDTYVSARMVSLASPCRSLMETEPLILTADELLGEAADQIRESDSGAGVVVDENRHPIGLLTRADLDTQVRRRVLLVDHAETGQSVPGIEQAEIVEILDHHHIGSIETRVPVAATFDPVGSTATLVTERFRRNGVEPKRSTATLLLGAVMSDTVILNSPTTTDRDVAVVEYLGRLLRLDPREFGREMFAASSDVAGISADELVRRDAKSYQAGSGLPFLIAQVEVVGKSLLDRREELLTAMEKERSRQGVELYALMVTDVLDQQTDLLVDGDVAAVARAFGAHPENGSVVLPGVMSRKKQVAPKLLSVL